MSSSKYKMNIRNMIKYINENIKNENDIINYANDLDFKDLHNLLKYLDKNYYKNSTDLISDYIYDKLYSIYESKIFGNNFSKLDRVYNVLELHKKLKKYNNSVCITPKLDGINVTLQKFHMFDKFKLFSKNKTSTSDSSRILDYINIKLKKINKYIEENNIYSFTAKGELILPKDKISKPPGRCEVNGLIKRKTIENNILQNVTIVFYSLNILNDKYESILNNQIEELELLKSLRLNIPEYKIIDLKNVNFENIIKEYNEYNKYEIDGFIIKEIKNENDNFNQIAFKFSSEIKETEVIDIIWNLTSNKYIPILKVKSVNICNIIINNITAHNAKKLINNKMGIGSIIEIEITGMTITTIKSVIKHSEEFNFPKSYIWDDKNIHIIPLNTSLISILDIEKFFKLLNFSQLGKSKLNKLIKYLENNNILESFNKISNMITLIKKIKIGVLFAIKNNTEILGKNTDDSILNFCKIYKNVVIDFLQFFAWIPTKNVNLSYNTLLEINSKIKENSNVEIKDLLNFEDSKIINILDDNNYKQVKIEIIIYKIKVFNTFYKNKLEIKF